MIIREKEPANLEMPFGELEGFYTPNERFYIRSHFPVPEVDLATWRLRIEGAVREAREWSLNDLRRLPATTLSATLECAGNSRVFLVPKVKGTQWELGAVGNAEWTGVSLGEILRAAAVKEGAREVILEGADRGKISDPPKPAGEIHYARSIPLGKALEDVLLAYEMNGEALPPFHGFPLRAIVPGWYGMAAVKWLQRIVVIEQPYNGYYQTVDYALWQRDDAGALAAWKQAKRVQPDTPAAVRAGDAIHHVLCAPFSMENSVPMPPWAWTRNSSGSPCASARRARSDMLL